MFGGFAGAFFLGALFVLAFAPFCLFWLYPLLLAFFFLMVKKNPRQAFCLGLAFGAGYFLANTHWVFVSMHTFGAMPLWLSGLATLLLALALGLYPALFAWMARALPMRLPQDAFLWALAWALMEWVRRELFSGFPWALAGTSQVPQSPLAGFFPWGGVTLASFAVALLGAWLALAWLHRKILPLFLGFFLLLLGWAAGKVSFTHPQGKPLPMTLLQGNVPQDRKWNPEAQREIFRRYLALAQQAPPSVLLTPESALPIFLDELPPVYLQGLLSPGKTLLLGIMEREAEKYYNSVAVISGQDDIQVLGRYRKVHLVPFGEYTPLPWLFGPAMALGHIQLLDFTPGPVYQLPLKMQGVRVAVSICYEDIFGEEWRRRAKGAAILANVSNDAWFGGTWALAQHAQHAQARALELQKPLARATNTGWSFFVDHKGQILAKAPPGKATILTYPLQGRLGESPYARWGDGPWVGMMFFLFFLYFTKNFYRQ